MKKKFLKNACSVALSAACILNTCAVSSLVIADNSTKYEFENGTYADSIVPDASSERYMDGASGDGFVFIENGGEVASVTVTVEETGMYDIILCYAAPYGSKIHNLYVNGVDQGQINCSEKAWTETNLGSVKLNAGENEIGIKSSWGWTNLDYIRVESSVLPELSGYDTTLSDPDAIPEAKSLMKYLGSVYGEHVISGQQEIYMYGPHDFEYEFEYIQNLTGELPAIRAFDYLNEANILYGSEDGTTDRMIDWVKNKNGIVTASWHITVPKNFESFTLGETSVDWANATYAPDETDFDTSNILVEGTKEREYWMACLEDLAASIQKLEDENIPLIFRPLHEAEGGGGETGSWFFWGQDGSAVYKDLWRLTYDTLVNDYDLHNIIWEWNSYNYETSTDWYPGDEYVDLIAYDKYNCTDWSTGNPVLVHNDSAISSTFYGIVEKYNGKKMVAMSENDSIPTLQNLLDEKAGWLYFCPWYDGGSDNINFLSNPIFNTKEDLTTMYQSEYCISLDELPANLYSDTEFPTDPTEETTEPSVDPTEPVTTPTEPSDENKVEAEISGSEGNYEFNLDAEIGDTLYVDLSATKDVTFANGCVGISATVDGTDYWVSYEWDIAKTDTVEIDITKPSQITFNDGADELTDEDVIAKVVAEAMSQTNGQVQVWWTNDASGEQIDNSNVTLTGAYIIIDLIVEPTEPSTDPTEPTTTAPTTDEPVVTTTVASNDDIVVPDGVEASAPGDVNLDGDVNIADVVGLNMFLLNPAGNPMSDVAMANSDCVKDNILTTADSAFLMNYVGMMIDLDQLGKA